MPYCAGMRWHSLRDLVTFILRSSKRIAVLVIGLALVVGGLAMLVLPGPGIVVVILGLAVAAPLRLLDRREPADPEANEPRGSGE